MAERVFGSERGEGTRAPQHEGDRDQAEETAEEYQLHGRIAGAEPLHQPVHDRIEPDREHHQRDAACRVAGGVSGRIGGACGKQGRRG